GQETDKVRRPHAKAEHGPRGGVPEPALKARARLRPLAQLQERERRCDCNQERKRDAGSIVREGGAQRLPLRQREKASERQSDRGRHHTQFTKLRPETFFGAVSARASIFGRAAPAPAAQS